MLCSYRKYWGIKACWCHVGACWCVKLSSFKTEKEEIGTEPAATYQDLGSSSKCRGWLLAWKMCSFKWGIATANAQNSKFKNWLITIQKSNWCYWLLHHFVTHKLEELWLQMHQSDFFSPDSHSNTSTQGLSALMPSPVALDWKMWTPHCAEYIEIIFMQENRRSSIPTVLKAESAAQRDLINVTDFMMTVFNVLYQTDSLL